MTELYNYGILTVATVMFGAMFFFKDMFRRSYGSGLKASLVMSLGGGIFGTLSLFIIQGFVFEFSWYALIVGALSAVNGLLFSFCSLKALGKIDLSLYSLFSMLGGMALPFVSGIFFHEEPFTLGKAVCFVIITAALLLSWEKGDTKSGTIYYVGVFVFNGMAGVISKAYHALPFEHISSAGYSILKSFVSLGIATVLLVILLLREKGTDKRKINVPCVMGMAGSGVLGHVANWLILLPLSTTLIPLGSVMVGGVPSSAQYPFITGGTMIVSTVLGFFTDKKPGKKEILAVAVAFVGVVLLIALPEIEIFKIIWR